MWAGRRSKTDASHIRGDSWTREHGLKDVLPLLLRCVPPAERPARVAFFNPTPPIRPLTFCHFVRISSFPSRPIVKPTAPVHNLPRPAGAFRPVPRGSFDSGPLRFDVVRSGRTGRSRPSESGKEDTHGNRLRRPRQNGRQHGPAPRAGLARREDQGRPHGRRLRHRPQPRPGRGGRRHRRQHAGRTGQAAQAARAPSGSWCPPATPPKASSASWPSRSSPATCSSTAATATTPTRSAAARAWPSGRSASSTWAPPAASGAGRRATA